MRLQDLNVPYESSVKFYAVISIDIDGEHIDNALIVSHPNYLDRGFGKLFLYCNSITLEGLTSHYIDSLRFDYSYAIQTNGEPTIEDCIKKQIRYDHRGTAITIGVYEEVMDIPDEAISWLSENGYFTETPYRATEGDGRESEETTEESVTVDEFLLNGYETSESYSGLHSYHYHHGIHMNEPIRRWRGHRIGVELEVEFDSNFDRTLFCDKPSNWFYRETDGSLGSYGAEIITIPLLPKDAKNEDVWTTLTSQLRNATSWDTGRCGLHVHIGREILGKSIEEQSETIGKLLLLYHEFVKDTRLNIKIYGRDTAYHDHCGKTDLSTAVKHLGSAVLKDKDVKDRVKNSVISKSHETRYFDINLQNDHTIEFRKGKGSINPKRIAMVVEWSEILCKYAKMTPWQQLSYSDFCNFAFAVAKSETLKNLISTYR